MNWSALHKQRISKLLTTEYMSSESSEEENDEDCPTSIGKAVLKVKKLVWLKKKYRDALHQIDSVYYKGHKKSRDKLKTRIPGSNSNRQMPEDAPRFAIKSEYRSEPSSPPDSELNSSPPPDSELNSSLSEHETSLTES